MGALFGFTGTPQSGVLEQMAATLKHRGSDPLQTHITEHGSLGYLPPRHVPSDLITQGKTQSPDDIHCGIYSRDGLTIALAGEAWCLAEPQVPKRVTLAELANKFTQQGITVIENLVGSFIAVLSETDKWWLVRDQVGRRTAFYADFEERLLFAIEPKGVLVYPGVPRKLRPAALAQYMSFSFVPGAGTMLEGVQEVPPSHYVKQTVGKKSKLVRYAELETKPLEHLAQEQESKIDAWWEKQFQQTFSDCVALGLPQDEPVAVFLSGGLDSSVVTAEVARQYPGKIQTFALHFGEGYPNELEYAKAVAERVGTEHQEVLLRPQDFLSRLEQMIWHLDDPVGDPITMPNFELSRIVSQTHNVIYNGEGGDPCFGGPKNIPMCLQHWYGGIQRPANFREQAYLASYRRGYEELTRLLTPEVLREIDFERDLESILTPFFATEQPSRFLDKLQLINIQLKGAHLILPKVERMTGAWGLRVREPLFDERMVQMSFQLPGHLKLAQGDEKIILKRCYENQLPESVIKRPKSGMRVPVHYWFQKELKKVARSVLRKKTLKREGIFRPERVKQLLDYATEEGPGRYGLRLWMLLTFEIWRKQVLDRER
ncbi:Asparagine synthase [Planctomycetales bacterium 10988]|nr:Asparagine synthase [Planctomycetales bacterium 10988]